ncbi:MAG: hypothetical protein WCR72_11410 [Bacteroidota bacterium]
MNNKFVLLLITSLLICCCEKDAYRSTGTITAQDNGMCPCCGGYFIEIEGTDYRFEKGSLPGNFTFEDSQMPVVVELNWGLKSGFCIGYNWIDISKIRKK